MLQGGEAHENWIAPCGIREIRQQTIREPLAMPSRPQAKRHRDRRGW
jgi:hypothetical protein